ncbi:MAG: ABC transporter ATP-binding protein, partial [Clostridia bacterium]|nr:ABC transporter ATP-binding protein [Clostridia bacterium]
SSFTDFSNRKFQNALKIEEKINFNRNLFRRAELALTLIFELAFMLFGVLFVEKSMITLAGLLIIYMYYGKIEMLVSYLTNVKELTADGEVSATRIFEIVEGYEKETFGNKELENFSGNIKLENVEFGYNDETTVLDNLNMEFENGKMTAIVGKSGAGKSTILSLIAKLYDIKSGDILFDGVSISELTKNSIRGNVCEVSQSPYIFNASIRENLLFAKPEATEEELIAVLKQAEIYDDVLQMPNGIDTQIGERGVKISGGQRQRIAIARLLLKDAKVIVFDEATSALDNNNQKEIVKLLNSLKHDKTIIIVAHRLSTIVGSDKIYMLSEGKVLAEGKHDWLMKNCAEYKQLYKLEEEKAKDNIEE